MTSCTYHYVVQLHVDGFWSKTLYHILYSTLWSNIDSVFEILLQHFDVKRMLNNSYFLCKCSWVPAEYDFNVAFILAVEYFTCLEDYSHFIKCMNCADVYYISKLKLKCMTILLKSIIILFKNLYCSKLDDI